MKAKLLCDQEITNPELKSFDDIEAVRAAFFRGELSPEEYQSKLKVVAVAGTIIDHPRAYGLVGLGIAEPADAECARKVGERRLKRLTQAVEAAEALDVGQATGTAHDASDAQVAHFKAARAERRKQLKHVEGTVTPDAKAA